MAEQKEVKKTMRICNIDDEQGTGLDIIVYTDNSVEVKLAGNTPKMLLCIIRDAAQDLNRLSNLVKNLYAMQDVNDRIFNGELIDEEFVCGKVEDVIKQIIEESDTLKKTVEIKAFVEQCDNEDHLLKLLTAIKEGPDFYGKSQILEFGSTKLKSLVGKHGGSKAEC